MDNLSSLGYDKNVIDFYLYLYHTMKTVAIIPAFNEEKTIGEVVSKSKKYADQIIVIDDGSKDGTCRIAADSGATVYRHLVNRGLGGALGTGIKAALQNEADIIVTLDADGQHDPAEIPRLIKPMINGEADAVIGSRFLANQPMPLFRKLGNPFFNLVTFLLFGVKTTDSQSGMRAFSKKAAQSLEIRSNGMEVSSEILKEIKIKQLKLKEVPIKSIYTDYSLSKGQGLLPGIKTLIKLLWSLFSF